MESLELYLKELDAWQKKIDDSEILTDFSNLEIDETYFYQIDEMSSLLVQFYHKYIETPEVNRKLYNVLEKRLRYTYEILKLCFVIDVYRCYNGLNHSTSFNTKEGFALMLLLSKIYEPNIMWSYQSLDKIKESTISLINILPFIAQCSTELPDNESELFISKLLISIDLSKDILYRKFIYRFCKMVAEVDNKISISEKEWLEEILRLDDDDISNDIEVDETYCK